MKKVILSIIAIICIASFALADTSGKCGDGVNYTYTTEDRKVALSGTGPMYNFNSLNHAPWYSRSVYRVVMTGTITSVGDYAFSGQYDLTELTFCSYIDSIGEGAFASCFGLTSVTLPDRLTKIKAEAFYANTKLTSITIPAKVSSIASSAFKECQSITKFMVASTNQYYVAEDGVLYDKKKTTLLNFPMADEKNRVSYSVPVGVTTISEYAFQNSAKLQSIELPRTVKSLEYASLSSAKLTAITCAAKVPPAAAYAFQDTPSSATITIPTGKTAAYKAAPGWSKFTNFVEKDYPDYIDPDCNVPTGITTLGPIGYNEVTITWAEGNQRYFGVRYKKSSDSKYIEYPNRISKWDRAVSLTALEPKTSYDVVVYGICGTTIESDTLRANSAVFTFTTADVPAEQTKPTVENGWAYYGDNNFANSGDLPEGSYWGIMIPKNTSVDKYLDKVSVYAMDNSECEIVIMTNGATPVNATTVWSQKAIPQTPNSVCEFELIDPVQYDKSKNLWVFFRNTGEDYGKTFPVSYMSDVNASNARWLGLAGGSDISWMDLKDIAPDFTYTAWLVNAHFTNTPVYHPYAKDLYTSTVSNTGAVIVWSGRGDKYELRYRMEDNPEQEWTVIENISSKSRTITGLKKNVYYEVQVRAKQGEEYSDWSEVLRFYTEKKQAIDNVQADKQSATKLLKNGQLYILRDGKMYNITGMRIE